jgi:predicted enzyme related to lactoylglutathione lyase
VLDFERARAFYAALLDAPIERQDGGGYAIGLLPAPPGAVGARLVRDLSVSMGTSAPGATTAPAPGAAVPVVAERRGPLLYLSVAGRLRAAVQAVRDHGGTVFAEPHSLGGFGWRAIVVDTEGNRIALHSPSDG